MITIHHDDIGALITPPEDAGQMIEVSYYYADAEDGIVRRTHDRSDGSTVWHFASWDFVRGDFHPQNQRPRVLVHAWRPCTVS